MPTRFPITFQSPTGEPVARPRDGEPIIEVYFHRPTPPGWDVPNARYKALIDTGSQWNCACPDLLERHGCPLERAMIVEGVTGNADTPSTPAKSMFLKSACRSRPSSSPWKACAASISR